MREFEVGKIWSLTPDGHVLTFLALQSALVNLAVATNMRRNDGDFVATVGVDPAFLTPYPLDT